MDRFLTCLCDDDLTALIISGNPTLPELQERWAIILTEYYELKGETVNANEIMKLSNEIKRLQSHLRMVDVCVTFLSKHYSEAIANSLEKLGYSFKPVICVPDQYLNLLQVIVNRSKAKFVRLQQCINDLQQALAKATATTPTREEFEKTLIYIEEVQKVTYSMETLSVSKFVSLENLVAKKMAKATHGR